MIRYRSEGHDKLGGFTCSSHAVWAVAALVVAPAVVPAAAAAVNPPAGVPPAAVVAAAPPAAVVAAAAPAAAIRHTGEQVSQEATDLSRPWVVQEMRQ